MAAVLACVAASGQAVAGDPITDAYNQAWALLDRAQFGEARAAALHLIQRAPHHHRSYFLLVRASVRLGVPINADPVVRSAPAALREYALLEWTLAWNRGTNREDAAQHGQACIDADARFAPCYLRLFTAMEGHPAALDRFSIPPAAPAALADVIRAVALTARQQFREAAALLSRHLNALQNAEPDPELAVLNVIGGLFGRTSAWNAAVQARSRLFELAERRGVWEDWFDAASLYALSLDASGRTEEAQRVVDRAIAASRKLDLPTRATSLLHRRGITRSLAGDHEAAISALNEAKELSSSIGLENLWVLLDLARAYLRMGDLEAAELEFEQMLARCRAEGQIGQAAFALRGLSNTAAERGDYFRALRIGIESVRIFREAGADWQAGAGVGNLCSFAAALGDYDSAKRHCTEALASARRQQDTGETQRLLANQGSLTVQSGQFREAIDLLADSLQLAEAAKNKTFEAAALITLAEVHRKIGKRQPALGYAERALEVARQSGAVGSVGRALIEAANTRLAGGDIDRAEAALREAEGLAAKSGSDPIGREARRGLGQVARVRGDLAAAMKWLEAAVETTESMRARLLAVEHKAGFARENASVYEELIQVLGARDRQEPGKGFGLRALEVAERARARAFLDMLAESRADISGRLDAADRKRRDELSLMLSRAYREERDHPCEWHRTAIAEGEQNLADWSVEIRATHPRYASIAFPQPLDAGGVERIAREQGLTILEFALGEPSSYLWVVSRGATRSVALPGRAKIEGAVRELRRHLTRAPKAKGSLEEFHRASAKLYALLFGGLRGRDLAGKILIVPDGLLYYVPFEALLKGRTAVGEPIYLNDAATISYAASVSVAAEVGGRSRAVRQEPRLELLAFGAPAVAGRTGRDLAAVVRSAYKRAGFRMAPLPNARLELEALGRMFAPGSRKVVSGWAATEEAFKSEALDDYRRVHVASHAVLDENHPQRSGIVFTLGRGQREEDGILRVNEIVHLKMDADLVVISACETGLGKVVRGEGVVGLTRALMYAGARRVGVSLWAVNDASTAELMTAFYEGLRAGRPAAEALRGARRKVAREMGEAYRHPYFWAPFVVVGGI